MVVGDGATRRTIRLDNAAAGSVPAELAGRIEIVVAEPPYSVIVAPDSGLGAIYSRWFAWYSQFTQIFPDAFGISVTDPAP